ncbi:hypothetical protein Aduo_013689 [Ancylostoma duodenale]
MSTAAGWPAFWRCAAAYILGSGSGVMPPYVRIMTAFFDDLRPAMILISYTRWYRSIASRPRSPRSVVVIAGLRRPTDDIPLQASSLVTTPQNCWNVISCQLDGPR